MTEPPTKPGDPSSSVPLSKPSGEPAGGSPGREPARGERTARRTWLWLGLVVVLVIAVVAGFFIYRSVKSKEGKRLANPIEVRRLVATFPCTADRPGTPSNLQLTAGQEVIRVPRAGCAVVSAPIASVDRATSVKSSKDNGGCKVTISSTKEQGEVVDHASNVSDGQVRALVAGGYLLDLRAVLDYPGRPSSTLSITFTAPDQQACDAVSNALKLS